MDYITPGSSVHGVLQARILKALALQVDSLLLTRWGSSYKRLLQAAIYQQNGQLGKTDKFLERYRLSKVNQEEIENMKTLVTRNEIETVI